MTKLYRYTVKGHIKGHRQFPIDMLRHDSAWPASEADSAQLVTYRHKATERAINLVGMQAPAKDRWNSFGWEVIGDVSIIKVEDDECPPGH